VFACRNKLSKLEWKYIIIDEAQRMKDRESKLSQVNNLNKWWLEGTVSVPPAIGTAYSQVAFKVHGG
jgi:hypothetical protein